jgi:hypothetical protein
VYGHIIFPHILSRLSLTSRAREVIPKNFEGSEGNEGKILREKGEGRLSLNV